MMRPIERGDNPQLGDFDDYRGAFPHLHARLGPFCSYCERRIPTALAVEHIQPKGLPQYAHLVGRWDNFLLGCVNCNGTKTDKDLHLDAVFLPDRDNTGAAFEYLPDGKVVPAAGLTADQRQMAEETLALTGLDKPLNAVVDENGQLVAMDRVSQRMEVWLIAERSHTHWQQNPSDELREQIVQTARGHGFFSIWMTVFRNAPDMRDMFIGRFPGTATTCFAVGTTQAVSPRPSNGLPHGSKI
jgi:uncharacterized protein (TIGR02646 family)